MWYAKKFVHIFNGTVQNFFKNESVRLSLKFNKINYFDSIYIIKKWSQVISNLIGNWDLHFQQDLGCPSEYCLKICCRLQQQVLA